MRRNLFKKLIIPTVHLVMAAVLFSSAAHGFSEQEDSRHLLESFSVFLPVLPDQAKKPGWFKPKAKPVKKKKTNTSSSTKSASVKRKPIRSTQINKQRLSVPNNVAAQRAAASSAGRALSKNVGGQNQKPRKTARPQSRKKMRKRVSLRRISPAQLCQIASVNW